MFSIYHLDNYLNLASLEHFPVYISFDVSQFYIIQSTWYEHLRGKLKISFISETMNWPLKSVLWNYKIWYGRLQTKTTCVEFLTKKENRKLLFFFSAKCTIYWVRPEAYHLVGDMLLVRLKIQTNKKKARARKIGSLLWLRLRPAGSHISYTLLLQFYVEICVRFSSDVPKYERC